MHPEELESDGVSMSKRDVDRYLAKVQQPHRGTLQTVRERILSVIPLAEETISYGMPGFKVDGRVVAGFAAFQNHCSYFPHSGDVAARLKKELRMYQAEKGTVRFPPDRPLPVNLVRKLIRVRLTLETAKTLKKTGVARSYYDNGNVQSSGRIRNGKMHGSWTWYRKNGSVMRTGEFKNGIRTGTWRTFDSTGNLVRESILQKKTRRFSP